jgi:hypothetical protein
MNYLLSVSLALSALVIVLAPGYIIPESTTNSILAYIREHNTIVGGVLLVVAYFLYPGQEFDETVTETSAPMIEVASQSASSGEASVKH